MEDLFKRSNWTATKTLCLMKEGRRFDVAYDIAFNNNSSGLNSWEYHEARVAVKIWHRQWRAEKKRQQALRLAGAREAEKESHRDLCPVD